MSSFAHEIWLMYLSKPCQSTQNDYIGQRIPPRPRPPLEARCQSEPYPTFTRPLSPYAQSHKGCHFKKKSNVEIDRISSDLADRWERRCLLEH